MSLILAVEPDKRQAKQLSAVVRQQVQAELIVADSGAAALAALGDRIPDLILTPPLLPPKDEAVLTGWLRKMGDAAAHVQTLAIPILAEAAARGKEAAGSSSIFGRLRDAQPDTGPGCDPAMFADQVKVYLDRAGAERSNREPVAEPPAKSGKKAAPAPPPAEIVMASDEASPDVEEFDDMTFDDLVFEPTPANEQTPSPAPVPVSEPPVVMRTPTPFARPDKRVEPAVLKSWEAELGLESSGAAAPPLWRVGHESHADTAPAMSSGPMAAGTGVDMADARYAPLFRRLDELAAQHA